MDVAHYTPKGQDTFAPGAVEDGYFAVDYCSAVGFQYSTVVFPMCLSSVKTS